MKIKSKILIYFSSVVLVITSVTFVVIYVLSAANREEEFQQRQKQKIITTLNLLSEIKKTDTELIEAIDRVTINDLIDEKLLLFNGQKELIYSSIDDTPVPISKEMLSNLDSNNRWIETKDGLYDVVGTYIRRNGDTYFGISKAYDTFGYQKLVFLRNTLLVAFLMITIAVLLVSFYLAKKISKPITDLAKQLSIHSLGEDVDVPNIQTSTYEINFLNTKFRELAKRTYEAFAFQRHSINHISHQLKTPITVLTSELERIKNRDEAKPIKQDLENQIVKTKSLADIINILLQIAKADAGQPLEKAQVRIDEIIFDAIQELNIIFPDFSFAVNYTPRQPDMERLNLWVNEMLIRQLFLNLLMNCINYSNEPKAEIEIDCSSNQFLRCAISNRGMTISESEQKFLFNHFFRGENSIGKTGFGLGLMLVQKIVILHSGELSYFNPNKDVNIFEIKLPLS
ncbi:MAG: HAMP domain-containing sensor histidine kinase [Chitinophagaceae bacterium]